MKFSRQQNKLQYNSWTEKNAWATRPVCQVSFPDLTVAQAQSHLPLHAEGPTPPPSTFLWLPPALLLRKGAESCCPACHRAIAERSAPEAARFHHQDLEMENLANQILLSFGIVCTLLRLLVPQHLGGHLAWFEIFFCKVHFWRLSIIKHTPSAQINFLCCCHYPVQRIGNMARQQ